MFYGTDIAHWSKLAYIEIGCPLTYRAQKGCFSVFIKITRWFVVWFGYPNHCRMFRTLLRCQLTLRILFLILSVQWHSIYCWYTIMSDSRRSQGHGINNGNTARLFLCRTEPSFSATMGFRTYRRKIRVFRSIRIQALFCVPRSAVALVVITGCSMEAGRALICQSELSRFPQRLKLLDLSLARKPIGVTPKAKGLLFSNEGLKLSSSINLDVQLSVNDARRPGDTRWKVP